MDYMIMNLVLKAIKLKIIKYKALLLSIEIRKVHIWLMKHQGLL